MNERFDVYRLVGAGADVFRVYRQGVVSSFGELPDGEPLFSAGDEEACFGWCHEHGASERDDDSVRIWECMGTYHSEYHADVLRHAQAAMDAYVSGGRELGWGDVSIDHSWGDHTFRRSAAWKDEPTYYTLEQNLRWTTPPDRYTDMALRTRDYLVELYGMSDALHELGLDLVFTGDLKMHLFGDRNVWVRRDF